jgi:gliding motility-associated-like protein
MMDFKKCLLIFCLGCILKCDAQITGIKINGDPCTDFTLDLQALGTSSSPYFFWNFGDPASGVNDTITITGTSPSAFPTHTFSGPGIYNVCVSLQEPGQAVTTVCRVLNVGLCCTGIILSSDTCLQNSIPFSIFSDSIFNSVSWNFGDAASGVNNTSTALNPTHTFSSTGTYNVTATCGTFTATYSLTIVSCTVASCILNTSVSTVNTSCGINNGSALVNIVTGGTAPYNYSVNGSTTQPSNQFTNLASGSYTFVTTDANGCKDTALAVISPSTNTLQISTVATNTSCFGFSDGSITTSATGGNPPYAFGWSNALSSSTLQNLSAGNYLVTVTDANNCSATSSGNVAQPAAIAIDLGNDSVVCVLNTIQINAPPNFTSYVWSTGESTSNIQASAVGVYIVTATDVNRCTATDSIRVSISTPTVELGNDITIYQNGDGTTINPTITGGISGGTFTWTPSQFLSCTDCRSPLANPDITTTYNLTYTDGVGCSASDSIKILVEPIGTVAFPTAFSPNGDGNNDIFSAIGTGAKQFNLKIFNRWGELIFENNNFSSGWDGTYKGVPQPLDVYIYLAQITLQNNQTLALKGSLTLVR